MDTVFIMKDAELLVLLAAAGMGHLYGFGQIDSLEEKDVPYVIHEMARKEIISLDGEEFILSEPYLAVINGIKEAAMMLALKCGEELRATELLYIGKTVVALSDSPNDKGAVRIRMMAAKEVQELLDEFFNPGNQLPCMEEWVCRLPIVPEGKCIVAVSITALPLQKSGEEMREWRLMDGRYGAFVEYWAAGEKKSTIFYRNWEKKEIIQTIHELGGLYDTN